MSNSKLWIVCLFFCLLVFFSSLRSVKADVVFQDNFGSGNFNNWTVVGSPNIVTSPVVDGRTYSAQFPFYSTDSDMPSSNISYIQEPFPQSNTVTLEFNLQTDTIPHNIAFAYILNGVSSISIALTHYANNDSLNWAFYYPTSEKSGFMQTISYNIQIDTWCKFDVSITKAGANGTIQLSINDSPVFYVTNVNFNWAPTVFKLGSVVNSGNGTGNIYISNITVTNTAKIGQPKENPSPTPFPNETLNPTQPSNLPTPIPSSSPNSSPSPSTVSTHSSPTKTQTVDSLLLLPIITIALVGFVLAIVYA